MSENSALKLRDRFTLHERELIRQLRTPLQVQRYLNSLSYNQEAKHATLRSFRGVVRNGTVHCMEAAVAAAVLLEQHRYPPLLLSFESIDYLDHVMFVYQRQGRWGSVARSRDPGLHGRKPLFRTPRNLALSYVEPYVDETGRILGYAVVDLRTLGRYDWRLAPHNIWKTERLLQEHPHRPIRSSDRKIDRFRERFRAFKRANPNQNPMYFRGQERWTELPSEFM